MSQSQQRIQLPEESGNNNGQQRKNKHGNGAFGMAFKNQPQNNRRQNNQKVSIKIRVPKGAENAGTKGLTPDKRINPRVGSREEAPIQVLNETVNGRDGGGDQKIKRHAL